MNDTAKAKTGPETVYAKIAKVQAAIAKEGIGKTRQNQTPGANYNFRGIDEVYNALSPLMAQHGLCVLPRIIEHSLTERGKTSRGNVIWSAVVCAEFDFVSADDGSIHTIRTYGEAMDSSDKATNKAMSAAYKYAALMTFAVPTEGDNDADATTHEVEAKPFAPAKASDSDIAMIQQLVKATSADVGAILKAAKVEALPDLTPAQAGKVIERLQNKLADMAKAQGDAKQSLAEELGDDIPY